MSSDSRNKPKALLTKYKLVCIVPMQLIGFHCFFFSFFSFFFFFFFFVWIIRTFITRTFLRNNRRTISLANINNNRKEVGQLQEKDFLRLLANLAETWATPLQSLLIQQKLQLKKLLLISKLILMKVEMDQCTCFSFELIGARESIQIFASLSAIILSHFFSRAIWKAHRTVATSACKGEHNS